MYSYVLKEETDFIALICFVIYYIMHARQSDYSPSTLRFKDAAGGYKLVFSCVLNIYQITEIISLIFCSSFHENAGIDTSE